MNKYLVAFGLLMSSCLPAMANESDKLVADTREVLGKSLEGFLTFDFIDSDRIPGSRVGLGTKVVAWRVLSIQPSVSYGPNVRDRDVYFELMFPIRLSRLPIGDSELRDFFPDSGAKRKWLEMLVDGFFVTQNISRGGTNVGWRMAIGN